MDDKELLKSIAEELKAISQKYTFEPCIIKTMVLMENEMKKTINECYPEIHRCIEIIDDTIHINGLYFEEKYYNIIPLIPYIFCIKENFKYKVCVVSSIFNWTVSFERVLNSHAFGYQCNFQSIDPISTEVIELNISSIN